MLSSFHSSNMSGSKQEIGLSLQRWPQICKEIGLSLQRWPLIIKKIGHFLKWWSVFRIRIGFNADPEPDLYLNVDPDPGSQTNSDPCGSGSWSDFAVTKVVFRQEKYTLCKYYVIKHTYVIKIDFKRLKIVYVCFFCQFPSSWIRIRIPNTDPDPGQPLSEVRQEVGLSLQRLPSIFPRPAMNKFIIKIR